MRYVTYNWDHELSPDQNLAPWDVVNLLQETGRHLHRFETCVEMVSELTVALRESRGARPPMPSSNGDDIAAQSRAYFERQQFVDQQRASEDNLRERKHIVIDAAIMELYHFRCGLLAVAEAWRPIEFLHGRVPVELVAEVVTTFDGDFPDVVEARNAAAHIVELDRVRNTLPENKAQDVYVQQNYEGSGVTYAKAGKGKEAVAQNRTLEISPKTARQVNVHFDALLKAFGPVVTITILPRT